MNDTIRNALVRASAPEHLGSAALGVWPAGVQGGTTPELAREGSRRWHEKPWALARNGLEVGMTEHEHDELARWADAADVELLEREAYAAALGLQDRM